MKAIIISDIHGDLIDFNSIIDKLYKFNIDKLIILGDFCSYYSDSLDIAKRANDFSNIIWAVRGNADTDNFTNQVNFDMPTIKNIILNNKTITISHGHIYNPNKLPDNCGEIFISGHTHRKYLNQTNNRIIANPGSIGRPRDGLKSYLLLDENGIYLKDMQDNTINFIKFSS